MIEVLLEQGDDPSRERHFLQEVSAHIVAVKANLGHEHSNGSFTRWNAIAHSRHRY